ncbi:hypothetical protein SASPL_149470 [Salvia splendens]|uniref:Clp1 P-loop domain-containing protein n=1 Tax=Salvia splendens TaxID=180675 RepID=A0A8X8Z597_SALSN|nr:hypothetical protein SASPL_149470 [Salvia splendens]
MEAAAEKESPSPKIFIPIEWSTAADLIAFGSVSFPIAFVCGPKNSGKTTFSRHLVNVLLQNYTHSFMDCKVTVFFRFLHKRVAFLETDVGQTEFTPPGLLALTVIDKITPVILTTVSLFGARFDDSMRENSCKIAFAKCFFFGDISSKRDPTTYLAYIKALYDHYMETEIQGAGLPLVINTPGWVKGIGYEILVEMLRYISVTRVVKLQRSVLARNLPDGPFWLDEGDADAATTVIEINAPPQNHITSMAPMRKDALLQRDLRLMAYFKQCFPSDTIISTIKELSHALVSHPPYEIPISSIKIKHLHCQVQGCIAPYLSTNVLSTN